MERVGVKSGWRNCVRQGEFFTRRREKEGGCRRKVGGLGRELWKKLSAVQRIFWKGAGEKLGGVGVGLRKKWNQKVAMVSVE
jgi:hypothetical protein